MLGHDWQMPGGPGAPGLPGCPGDPGVPLLPGGPGGPCKDTNTADTDIKACLQHFCLPQSLWGCGGGKLSLLTIIKDMPDHSGKMQTVGKFK